MAPTKRLPLLTAGLAIAFAVLLPATSVRAAAPNVETHARKDHVVRGVTVDVASPPGPNDASPQLSVNDPTVDEFAGTVVFTVTLTGSTTLPVSVEWSVSPGTAKAVSDYLPDIGRLGFDSGPTQTVVISIVNDIIDEVDESFFLNLGNAVNATVAGYGVATIRDDDPQPHMWIDDVTVVENSGWAFFKVSLSAPSGLPVSALVTLADGSAVSADYGPIICSVIWDEPCATPYRARFSPGNTTAWITVRINNDRVVEPAETFKVNLSAPENGTIADAQAIGTIYDDDVPPNDYDPHLWVNDVSLYENEGTATFTLTLSKPSPKLVQVDVATADGSAGLGDYQPVRATIAFNPGETTKTVAVPIFNDTQAESTETFSVNLSTSTNAIITDPQGIGTIYDDDAPPYASDPHLWVNDLFVDESAGSAVFTLTLGAASTKIVYVDVATTPGTAGLGDYVATSSRLRFDPGETSKTVTVPIVNDQIPESTETFAINLASAQNAEITDAQGVATIWDDDPPGPPPAAQPTMSVSGASVLEGSRKGHKVKLVFTVTLSQASSSVVLARFATANQSAMAGSDYLFKHGNVIFQPGQTVKLITVKVRSDKLREADETLLLNIFNPTNATIGDGQGVGTILNDD